MYLANFQEIPVKSISSEDSYMPKIYTESYKTPRIIETAVQTLLTSKVYRINKNNAFLLSIYLPIYSPSINWGGLFIGTNIKINNTWYNLGNCGYCSNVMVESKNSSGSYFNTKYIDLIGHNIVNRDNDYDLQIEIKVSTYDRSATVNNLSKINFSFLGDTDTGTALPWAQDQNHVTLNIEEVSL